MVTTVQSESSVTSAPAALGLMMVISVTTSDKMSIGSSKISLIDSVKNTYLDVKIPKKIKATIYREYGNLFTYFLIVLFFIIGYAIRIKSKI